MSTPPDDDRDDGEDLRSRRFRDSELRTPPSSAPKTMELQSMLLPTRTRALTNNVCSFDFDVLSRGKGSFVTESSRRWRRLRLELTVDAAPGHEASFTEISNLRLDLQSICSLACQREVKADFLWFQDKPVPPVEGRLLDATKAQF